MARRLPIGAPAPPSECVVFSLFPHNTTLFIVFGAHLEYCTVLRARSRTFFFVFSLSFSSAAVLCMCAWPSQLAHPQPPQSCSRPSRGVPLPHPFPFLFPFLLPPHKLLIFFSLSKLISSCPSPKHLLFSLFSRSPACVLNRQKIGCFFGLSASPLQMRDASPQRTLQEIGISQH